MESERERDLVVQLIQMEGHSGDMNYIKGVAKFILAREAEKDRRIEEAIGILISGTNKSDSVGDLMYDRLAIQEACKVLKGEK